MKKVSVSAVIILLLSFAAPAVFAEQGPTYQDSSGKYHHDNFFDRIENQQKRINKGIKSGELTQNEAAILQGNLDWIKGRYTQLKADSVLTKNEREGLDRLLDENSEMIKDRRHNPAKRLYDTNLEERIKNQQKRIDDGVSSGRLTRKEADIVQDNLGRIRKKYSRMRSNDVLTTKEIEKLDRLLDENDKMINRKMVK